MTADDIKAVACCYWRFDRHCPIVATETTIGSYGLLEYPPDVMAVSKNGFLVETEVKVSIADLRREIKKTKYRTTYGFDGMTPEYRFPAKYTIAKYFYFAMPRALVAQAKPILRDLYPGAGLLAVEEPGDGVFKSVLSCDMECAVKPKALPGAVKLDTATTHKLTLRIVNQMCSAMLDAANARRGKRGVQLDLEIPEDMAFSGVLTLEAL